MVELHPVGIARIAAVCLLEWDRPHLFGRHAPPSGLRERELLLRERVADDDQTVPVEHRRGAGRVAGREGLEIQHDNLPQAPSASPSASSSAYSS